MVHSAVETPSSTHHPTKFHMVRVRHAGDMGLVPGYPAGWRCTTQLSQPNHQYVTAHSALGTLIPLDLTI